MALKMPELISIWLGNYNILYVFLSSARSRNAFTFFTTDLCVLLLEFFANGCVGENRRPNDVLNIILTFLLQRFLFTVVCRGVEGVKNEGRWWVATSVVPSGLQTLTYTVQIIIDIFGGESKKG